MNSSGSLRGAADARQPPVPAVRISAYQKTSNKIPE
jgi:hypothetical protein